MRKAVQVSLGIFVIGIVLAVFLSKNGIHETSWIYPPCCTMEEQIFSIHEAVNQPVYYVTASGQVIDELAPIVRDDRHAAKQVSFWISIGAAILTIVLGYLNLRPRMKGLRSRVAYVPKSLWLYLGFFLVSAVLASFFSINGFHETTWVHPTVNLAPNSTDRETFVIHKAVNKGFYYTGPSGQLIAILPPQIRDDWHAAELTCLTISGISAVLGVTSACRTFCAGMKMRGLTA